MIYHLNEIRIYLIKVRNEYFNKISKYYKTFMK